MALVKPDIEYNTWEKAFPHSSQPIEGARLCYEYGGLPTEVQGGAVRADMFLP